MRCAHVHTNCVTLVSAATFAWFPIVLPNLLFRLLRHMTFVFVFVRKDRGGGRDQERKMTNMVVWKAEGGEERRREKKRGVEEEEEG
jgi:hypothetical protein